MTDLTKITTPFGLLSPLTQFQLSGYTGAIEVYTPTGWQTTVFPRLRNEMVYRAKPLTRPSIDPSHVDTKYNWLARDMNGDGWLYADLPWQSRDSFHPDCGEMMPSEAFASYKPGTCAWEDSLVNIREVEK